MKLIIAVLFLALLLTNWQWYRAYHRLDLHDMQTEAWLDWAEAYRKFDNDRARVNCGLSPAGRHNGFRRKPKAHARNY